MDPPESGDQSESELPSDTPAADLIWDGLLAWMRGTFAVIAVVLAIHATLGYPRPADALLTRGQLAFLVMQALASSLVIAQSGGRLSRHLYGAIAVALVAGVPATLAVLMIVEWSGGRRGAGHVGPPLGGERRSSRSSKQSRSATSSGAFRTVRRMGASVDA